MSSVPLIPRAEVEEMLKSQGFPPSEIEEALYHPVGLAFDGPDGKKVVLRNHGVGYEKVDDTPEDPTSTMRDPNVTIMRALVDEPDQPKGRRIGSTMPIKQGTVFFSAPNLAPQPEHKVLVGHTITLPLAARQFTGDKVSLKIDPFPLPPGANFVDHGDGNATLTFTPTEPGAWDFVVTGSDGIQQLSQSIIIVAERVPPTQKVARPDPKE